MNEFVSLPDRDLVSSLREEQSLTVMLRLVPDGLSPRLPLSLALLVDTSGSMSAQLEDGRSKIEHVIQALEELAVHPALEDQDELLLVKFDDEASLLYQGPFRNTEALRNAVGKLADYNGLTYMAGGYERVCDALQEASHTARKILLFTDGQAHDESKVSERILSRLHRERLPNVGFGVGPDYNESLLTRLADTSGGDFHHLDSLDQFGSCLEDHLIQAKNEGLRNARLNLRPVEGVKVRGVRRVVPTATRLEAEDENTWLLGNLPSDQPSVFLVRLQLPRRPNGRNRILSAQLSYEVLGEPGLLDSSVVVEYVDDEERVRRSGNQEVRDYSLQRAGQELIDEARRAGSSDEIRSKLRQAQTNTQRFDNPMLQGVIEQALQELDNQGAIRSETWKRLSNAQRNTSRISSHTPRAVAGGAHAGGDPRGSAWDQQRRARIREGAGVGERRRGSSQRE